VAEIVLGEDAPLGEGVGSLDSPSRMPWSARFITAMRIIPSHDRRVPESLRIQHEPREGHDAEDKAIG